MASRSKGQPQESSQHPQDRKDRVVITLAPDLYKACEREAGLRYVTIPAWMRNLAVDAIAQRKRQPNMETENAN